MSSASENALQKFTRNLIVPSNAKKGPDGYTYYAPRTDFFVDNMASPNYFENEFVQTSGTVGYWLEKCGIWFTLFLFIKLIIDINVTVMKTLEIHRITGRSVSFAKVVLSATYNLFMVSILSSVYSPAKPTESPTPIVLEIQESTENIYPSDHTLPNNNRNTVSPASSNYHNFHLSTMTQEDYSLHNLNSLLSKDNITDDDLVHLPELLLEKSKKLS